MQRLHTRAQFQFVLANSPFAKTAHFALHCAPLASALAKAPAFPVADVWLGVMLPKRWAKRAVTRNTLRRQIYEVVRNSPGCLPPAAWVVRLRSEFGRQQFVSATSEQLSCAARAELMQLIGPVSVNTSTKSLSLPGARSR